MQKTKRKNNRNKTNIAPPETQKPLKNVRKNNKKQKIKKSHVNRFLIPKTPQNDTPKRPKKRIKNRSKKRTKKRRKQSPTWPKKPDQLWTESGAFRYVNTFWYVIFRFIFLKGICCTMLLIGRFWPLLGRFGSQLGFIFVDFSLVFKAFREHSIFSKNIASRAILDRTWPDLGRFWQPKWSQHGTQKRSKNDPKTCYFLRAN